MKALTLEKYHLLHKLAWQLKIPTHNLVSVIAFETSETFDPAIRNKISGAVGLIQFTKKGLTSLPTEWIDIRSSFNPIKTTIYTLESLAKMSFEEQLEPVYLYLKTNKAQELLSLSDLYMTILAPNFVGKPSSSVLYEKPSKAYMQNALLDKRGKGFITKQDASDAVYSKYFKVCKRILELEGYNDD